MKIDVVVVGGGPSGMQAALSASEEGSKVLLVERDTELGGILNQCIHNGFGLHYFGEELTGPEYAFKLSKKVKSDKNITILLETFVTKIEEKKIELKNKKGVFVVQAKAIVLASGCRERTAGAINLAGNRPSGIYTAGLAQKMINHYGKVPGKSAVILGSGDIGLIMCRRLLFEGVEVKAVLELMPTSAGLARNIQQCVKDFNVPLLFSHTITRVVGEDKLEGVYFAKVDENLKPILSTEKFIKCDTLLLSVGLVPENDLLEGQIQMDAKTKSAVVDENRQTSAEGVFASGNVLHIHDLADNATIEGGIAGKSAALFAKGKLKKSETKPVLAGEGVSYTIPQEVSVNPQPFKIYFRVRQAVRNKWILVKDAETLVAKKIVQAGNPGEMLEIEISANKIQTGLTVSIGEVKL